MFDEKLSENFRALMLIAKSMLVGCAGAADQPNFHVNRSSFKLLHDNARNRREFSTCLAGISQFTTYRNEAVKIVKIHTFSDKILYSVSSSMISSHDGAGAASTADGGN